jgi:hypothetical protein
VFLFSVLFLFFKCFCLVYFFVFFKCFCLVYFFVFFKCFCLVYFFVFFKCFGLVYFFEFFKCFFHGRQREATGGNGGQRRGTDFGPGCPLTRGKNYIGPLQRSCLGNNKKHTHVFCGFIDFYCFLLCVLQKTIKKQKKTTENMCVFFVVP